MALHAVSQLHAANAYTSTSSAIGTTSTGTRSSSSLLYGLPPGALLRPMYSDRDKAETEHATAAGTAPLDSADAAQLSAMGLYGIVRLWLWGRQQQPPVQLLPYSPAAVFQLCTCLTETVLRLREDAARRTEHAQRGRKGTGAKRGAAGAAAAAAAAWDSDPEQGSTLTSLPLALNAAACAAVMLPACPCRVDQDRYFQEARGALLQAGVVQKGWDAGEPGQSPGEEEHGDQGGAGAEAGAGGGARAVSRARLARWWGSCLRAVAAVAAQGLTEEREETLLLATHLLTLNANRAAVATATGLAGSAVAGARSLPVLSSGEQS